MIYPNESIPCQWPQCYKDAKYHIFHDVESIHVCEIHRGAVIVNIETHGKIWIFKKELDINQDRDIIRPKEGALRCEDMGKDKVMDADQIAAKKADAAAEVAFEIPPLVQPKKRRVASSAKSRRIIGNEE